METMPPPLPKGRTIPINGDAVRRLRLQREWNTEELARKAGCTSRTIDNVERGGKRVYAITLLAIANALGVSHAVLLGEPFHEHAAPEGRRVAGVCIHFTMNFQNVDASDELVSLMKRLAEAIGAWSEIEVFALEDGSLIVVVGMSEEDALKLVAAFGEASKDGEGRLDALAVEEISFPPSQTNQQVAAVIRKVKPEDFAATSLEESNLHKLGLDGAWYLLKIAQYEEEGRTGRGGDPRKAEDALRKMAAKATMLGMAPEEDAVFAARLLLRSFLTHSTIVQTELHDGGGLRIVRRLAERRKPRNVMPTPPTPEGDTGDAG